MDKLKLILNVLPLLIALIKSVETVFPEKGQGAVKLALVKEILVSVDASVSAIWPTLETIIAGIVKALNATGIFKG